MGDPSSRRPSPETLAFTLGYEGRDLTEVLAIVRAEGIEQVLDVRENASSRKPGFGSEALQKALSEVGVTYAHLPDLGCEREARHALWRGEATERFRARYRQRLADRPEAVRGLFRQVRNARSMLLCMERDPSRCHRMVLAERLRAEGFVVRDL